MSLLAQQQQALVQALWSVDHRIASYLIADSGYFIRDVDLNVYQNNGLGLAVRALATAYPVVAALIGKDSFRALAHALWLAHPPSQGDISRWGEQLPGVLQSHPIAVGLPYLADVARLEWDLHCCEWAAPTSADPHSFSGMACTPLDELYGVMATGFQLWASDWPVVSLWQAHQAVATPSEWALARERLAARTGEWVLTCTSGQAPRVFKPQASLAERLLKLANGASLGQVISPGLGPEDQDLEWLAQAVQNGWLIGLA
jgi:hypothetical protein